MKKAISFVLCLVLILSVVSTALAVPMTPSVEQQVKDNANQITEGNINIKAKDSAGITVNVVIASDPLPGWDEEIVVTPLTVLDRFEGGGKSALGGNLEGVTSQQKVLDILDAAYDKMTAADRSLYNLTGNNASFCNREDLRLCNLFEVTYATRQGSETQFTKKTAPPRSITLEFQGITDYVVCVLHGNDAGNYWYPMPFEQVGTKLTVRNFTEFCPIAFVTTTEDPATNPVRIQPTGGGGNGGGTPTSPQTGELPAGYALCALTAAIMAGCLYVRSRKEKRA